MSWPTKYKVLTSWKDNHLSSLCSSDTLKEGENMFGLRQTGLFAEVSSSLLIQAAEYFTAQKAFSEYKCAPCGLNLPVSMLLMADIWVVGLLELLLQLLKDLENEWRK